MQPMTEPSSDFQARVLPRLAALLGDRISTSRVMREQHGHGEGLPDSAMPDAVAFAQTTEEVAAIAAICNDTRTPLIPFGAGSSLEGHVVPLFGGVALDLSGMTRIIAVNAESMDCRVEAGVTKEQLNSELRASGLFFPVDPGAHATLGGMAATRASGTNAVRYGTMREVTLGLTVVTPNGRIIRTGGRARKSAAGLDLTRLYVGSEGTLGVITEVALKLSGIPETISSAVCQFPDMQSAVGTVIAALQIGINVARIELADEMQMRACIRYSKLDEFQEQPTLFFEFHGTPAVAAEQTETMQALAEEFGGNGFQFANRPEERSRLWTARHNTYFANVALIPGHRLIGTDACVPISELAACIEATRKDIEESGMTAPLVGHVGDGNFHLAILFDPENPEDRRKAEALASRVSLRAIQFGGTCSGEHGIGIGKIRYMETEHGVALDVMRTIKTALDPNGIMNPGKMLPSGMGDR
ncbi:D-lactate dehydrogenase (cytochrome) [Rhizobium subbaraonis]|uniref:D-lactate dehydrogenase (cytochrome) n=2 Tax=Rhizobium subbaraonis TaxID=908946 RepID=A0A285UTG1_9HYPH|nr:D-lactate dehydrogenase (cytochrome) [Rhizobium subbaraonis]